MSNNIVLSTENQAFLKLNCKFSDEVCGDPALFFSSLSEMERLLVEKFLYFSFTYKRVYFSVYWIKKQIGCGKTKAHELLGSLKDKGVISWLHRGGNTNLYKIASDFYKGHIQSKLGHIFTILREVRSRLTVRLTTIARSLSNIKRYLDINVFRKGKKYPSKRNTMDYENIVSAWDGISPTLNSKDYDKVSLKHKINLSAFPEFIVEEADFCRFGTNGLRDIPAYMFKVCWDKANRLGIAPNFGWANKLKDRYSKEIAMEDHIKRRNKIGMSDNEYQYRYERESGSRLNSKHPQKKGQGNGSSICRSQRLSLTVNTQKAVVKERLLTLQELHSVLATYDALHDKTLGRIFKEGLMKRQEILIQNLSPSELEHWTSSQIQAF